MSVHHETITAHRTADPLAGKLLTAGHPDFDHSRLAWNLAVDQAPAAIVEARSEADVVAAVVLAQELGLRLTPQATGHGAAPLGALADTILLKTDRLRTVSVDPQAGVVRVEAGATWSEAVEAAGHHGLGLPAGSSPDVGVVGYTLGGGLSWIGRRYGLACNSVTAVDLVTADGRAIRADAEHEADLFWALRGGGGAFGVVTALELRAIPIADVYAGLLWWPIEHAAVVLHRWRELTAAEPPDELTTVGRLLRLPALPEVPEPLRGRSFVVVEVIHVGDPAGAGELLAPLRALGPEIDTIEAVPIQGLSSLHMDPDHPVPFVGDGALLAELPPQAIDTVVQIAGPGVESPLLSVEIRHLGGELARARPGGGARSKIDAPYALYAVGIAPAPEIGQTIAAGIEHLIAGMKPWSAREMCLNFAETRRDPGSLWSEHAYRRLRQIKARFDPDDLIRSNHPIVPG